MSDKEEYEKYEQYMEDNYEGNIVQQYKQWEDDKIEAKFHKEKADRHIERQKKSIQGSFLQKGEITEEEILNLFSSYSKMETEYLVHGALLTCTKATVQSVFIGPYAEEYGLTAYPGKREELTQSRLIVDENPMSSNELYMATVADSIKFVNITPFTCNCSTTPDRSSELELIEEHKSECKKYGTCRYLMNLNEQWENLPSQVGYFNYIDNVKGKLEGINMTSILFCKHGGFIYSVDSGQQIVKDKVKSVSEALITLLKKYETGKDCKEGEPALTYYVVEGEKLQNHTIGWGHKTESETEGRYIFADGRTKNLWSEGTIITKEEAEEILVSDIKIREEKINRKLEENNIDGRVNQQFYDALFLLVYQIGNNCLNHKHLSSFLTEENFDLNNTEEIMMQFGDYSSGGNIGVIRRRADEIDIILNNEYERDYDEKRYGDIWGKKTYPDGITNGFNNMEDSK